MSEATLARTYGEESSHYYSRDGQPMYSVPKKDGKGERPTNINDCRKLNLLPSVTTILRVLNKPALNSWITEQSCLSVLTAPKRDGESLDDFVKRVLKDEKQQDAEARKARDRGTEIHAALEMMFQGQEHLLPWGIIDELREASEAIAKDWHTFACEKILVGDGYAGKADLIQTCDECWRIVDYKTCKELPQKGAWPEHRLQLAALAQAFIATRNGDTRPIVCANCYISTTEPGKFLICEHDSWQDTYEYGFKPLVAHWQWANGFITRPDPEWAKGA